jgi:hypothetical protein
LLYGVLLLKSTTQEHEVDDHAKNGEKTLINCIRIAGLPIEQLQGDLKVSIQGEIGLLNNTLYTGTNTLIAHTAVHADNIPYHMYGDF